MEHTQIKEYIQANKQRFLDELIELLKIPSISAKPEHAPDMTRMAEAVKTKFIAAGADKVEVCATKGYPVVYAEKIIDTKLPTILVYGHYDVQPAEPLELWDSPPFEPTVRDGRIYARGSVDDKGQLYLHIKALEAHLTTRGSLPVNIIVLAE